ncbi:bifunctional DNA primase/polymerase [Streptacidiphilus sp. EB129]|jgi:hypothetical protein|uniref:bifunctional DNA primase/polymerase n=1 Tax=Streptacidiphilus sp. EB129 TaxID=3156262 RepID=UPI003512E30B
MRGVLTILLERDLPRRDLFRWGRRRRERALLLAAATTCARDWRWPVVPGALPGAPGADGEQCSCPRPDCPTPGAHPHDPSLLAATTDARMVRWWWGRRPDAPIVVATGGPVSAVSLPLQAGVRVLDYFDALRIRTGPVIATPTRCLLLVAPYTMQELAELLIAQEWVPTSLRYHGTGGYVVLPPSRVGGGDVGWLREPEPRSGAAGAPWLPSVGDLMEALVAASTATPDGARLAF